MKRPLAVDFVVDVFQDQALAARVRKVLGTVPINNLYEIDEQVDGFHIHIEQFEEPLSWRAGNIFLELVIDGCGRVPTTREATRYDEGPAKWGGT